MSSPAKVFLKFTPLLQNRFLLQRAGEWGKVWEGREGKKDMGRTGGEGKEGQGEAGRDKPIVGIVVASTAHPHQFCCKNMCAKYDRNAYA